MKNVLAAIVLCSATAFTAQAATHEYQCECYDTGLECEGMEKMNIEISGETAVIDIGSEDWEMNDQFEVTLNPNYKPRNPEHMNYNQFKINAGGGGYGYNTKKSSFLVQKTLSKGKKSGYVLFQSVADQSTGGGFYSWQFNCTKQ